MKIFAHVTASAAPPPGWPDAASLAALRAWLQGMASREAVAQYLPDRRVAGQSSRALISRIKRQLVEFATSRNQLALAQVLQAGQPADAKAARAAIRAIELLRVAPKFAPLIGDDVGRWLDPRVAHALALAGIKTLADLTLRVPHRRRWWTVIPALGRAGAARVEAFFAQHPDLTERARALVITTATQDLVPWERLVMPEALDGSMGAFRAPRSTCALGAADDYQAVHAWLSLHESPATQRAYRKEAERLILWAIVERGKALSSLTTEDAIAYRTFIRHPSLRARWTGPSCSRDSVQWRPFAGPLAVRSASYALSVLGALFGWLIAQRYVLANPFSGIKLRGTRAAPQQCDRVFSQGEWNLLRTVAEGLEWSYGWETASARRLRFILDFGYATGLRASELVGCRLGDVYTDAYGDQWLRVLGKGAKPGKVVLPPLARGALERYLLQRGLPVTPTKWLPGTPIIGNLNDEPCITAARWWAVVKRFFAIAAIVVEHDNAAATDKLRQASPHWMRHTHATHALDSGAELTAVRDNLRHASISTTPTYLHGDDAWRAKQLSGAFKARAG